MLEMVAKAQTDIHGKAKKGGYKLDENKTKVYIAVGVIVAVLLAWYVLSGNESGGKAEFTNVENRINRAAEEQRATSDELGRIGQGINDSAGTADNISRANASAENAISDAQRANASSKDIIQDSRERLARCQSIIDNMEKGAGSKDSGDKKAE